MKEQTAISRTLILAAFFGLSGVALGAFGAHALHEHLSDSGRLETWETAVQYHLVHAVALLVLAGFGNGFDLRWVARSWTFGILVFSGSLYTLCLSGMSWLGAVTPIGGVALMGGWALLGVRGWQSRAS